MVKKRPRKKSPPQQVNQRIGALAPQDTVLGMVRQRQNLFFDCRFSHMDLHSDPLPDFVKLAEAWGCAAFRVTDRAWSTTRRVLSVSPTDDPSETRMTIGVDAVSAQALEQIIKQLNKLIEIHKIAELEPGAVTCELILVKVRSDVENRSKIIDTVALLRAKAIDASLESLTIEATARREKLDVLLQVLEHFGIVELVQSGQVTFNRGVAVLGAKRPG